MAGPKKEEARQRCRDRGIPFSDRDTIDTLNDKADEHDRKHGKTPRAHPQTRPRTRAGSARSTASRSGGGTGGSRARTAALAKSAPTVRMRVDNYEHQPARQPGSADIIAVALVVFMCVLAACNTPAKGKGGPHSRVPAPVIVAHA